MKPCINLKRIAIVFIGTLLCICLLSDIAYSGKLISKKPELQFREDGTFKIVQFTDIQDGSYIDPRTIKLMNNILDFEKPDLVVLTGDNIDGKCKSLNAVKKAIDNIGQPMEKRNIPWAVVFGNHDDEHGKMSKKDMMKYYIEHSHNISKIGPENIDGIGNYNLLIKGSKSDEREFNIYMLDSGKYAPADIGGYDWIKDSQINWYRKTAKDLKVKSGKLIPALMFFHIPLPELRQVWNSGKAIGERNEGDGFPKVNSGLFNSLIEMGDVKGVFVGHNHINDYMGELYGIKLGYSRNVGYGTYGKKGFSRGGRVFLINESNPANFQTWMRLDSDFEN